jgi:hypothetical protein
MKSLDVKEHFCCTTTRFLVFERKSDHRGDNENMCSWKKALFEKIRVKNTFYTYHNIHDALLLLLLLLLFCVYMIWYLIFMHHLTIGLKSGLDLELDPETIPNKGLKLALPWT